MSTSGTSFNITIGCLSGCPTKSVYKIKHNMYNLNKTIHYFKIIPESKDYMLKEPFCVHEAFDLQLLMSHLQMLHWLIVDQKQQVSWIDDCSIGGKTSGIVHCFETYSL